MAEEKKFYWLKLREDFFRSNRIKKLRKLAGGDTYTIIYLKMQLAALKTDGILTWTGLEDDIASELALELDEEPENVEVVLRYLLATGLAEAPDAATLFLPWVVANTGSETSAAERMRRSRERKELENRNNVTPLLQPGYTEIEIDTEIRDKSKEKEEKPSFHKHGEYGWVKLTDDQYSRLLKDMGQEELDRCIQYVDESAQKNGNRNGWKDWNLVLRSCHRDKWYARPARGTRKITTAAEYTAPKPKDMSSLRKVVDEI